MFDLLNEEDLKRSTSNDIIQQYQKNQEFGENFSSKNLIALQEKADSSEGVDQISNLQSMADKSDVTNKTNYITQNSNDLYSNNLETETIQRVENEEMDIGEYWEMQQLAINSGIDTSVTDDEQKTIMEEGNTWTSWFKKNRTILIVAGVITIGGLLVLYQKMNKQDIPTGGIGGSGASSGGASSSGASSGGATSSSSSSGGASSSTSSSSVASSSSSSSGGTSGSTSSSSVASSSTSNSGEASSSSLSSFAKQLEENIIVKSMIEALNNCGEVAPPCPHDPVTGLPNFDAWEELLGLAIKVAARER